MSMEWLEGSTELRAHLNTMCAGELVLFLQNSPRKNWSTLADILMRLCSIVAELETQLAALEPPPVDLSDTEAVPSDPDYFDFRTDNPVEMPDSLDFSHHNW